MGWGCGEKHSQKALGLKQCGWQVALFPGAVQLLIALAVQKSTYCMQGKKAGRGYRTKLAKVRWWLYIMSQYVATLEVAPHRDLPCI